MDLSFRQVHPLDRRWITEVADGWDATLRWCQDWGARSPTAVGQRLWDGVAVQSVVAADGVPAGLLQITNLDLWNDIASFDFVVNPDLRRTGEDAFTDFVGSAFDAFPLRKLCVALPRVGASFADLVDLPVNTVGSHRRHLRLSTTEYCDVEIFEVWNNASGFPR